jgi:hypothetical protein
MRCMFVWIAALSVIVFLLPKGYAQENPSPGASPPASGYSVQLVPFREQQEAAHWLGELSAKGYHPYLTQGRDAQGVEWFAVRIADYATIGQAEDALVEFKRVENLPAFVTRRDTIFPAADGAVIKPTSVGAGASAPAGKNAPLEDLRRQVQVLQEQIEGLEKEAEARRMLRMTKEEESQKQTEVLTAAGREYTLIPRKNLGFEYDLIYNYFSTDILRDLRNDQGNRLSVERSGNHVLTNQLFTEYGLLNNLSLNIILPFVYKYDNRSSEDDRKVTDLGDIAAGLQYQPFKESDALPSIIVALNGSFPTGRSPYKINPDEDLSTGNGYYSAGGSLTFSKTVDPSVAFGSISYSHPFSTTDTDQILSNGLVLREVEAGDTFAFNLGIGFALSYNTSLNLAYQYAYHLESNYHFTNGSEFGSSTWVTSSFSIGTGWRLSSRFSLYIRVDIGLTHDDPDFGFSIRIPVRFNLGD